MFRPTKRVPKTTDIKTIMIYAEAELRNRSFDDALDFRDILNENYPDYLFSVSGSSKDLVLIEQTTGEYIVLKNVLSRLRRKPEEILQDEVLNYLRVNKIWHFVYHANVSFGLPDIVAIVNGFFIGIELKREDGKGVATVLQKEMEKSIRRAGGLASICSSLEDVKNLINEAKNACSN